jgi:hypothetical protein
VHARIGHAALAHVEDAGEGRDAGDVVHDDAAGEVQHAPLRQDAAAPDHVNEGEVDEEEPGGQEEHVGLEGDAIRERAGDECRGDDGEHHLIGAEDDHGDGVVDGGGRVEGDAGEEGPVEVADDAGEIGAGLAAAEAEREAADEPEDRGPPMDTKLCIMMARTFLRPTRPP